MRVLSRLLSLAFREVEKGVKPTCYFFRCKNQRAAKNSFESLVNSQDQEMSSRTDMESTVVEFYKNLYSKDSLDLHVQ